MINNISIFFVAHPLSQPIENLPIEPLKNNRKVLKTRCQPKYKFCSKGAIQETSASKLGTFRSFNFHASQESISCRNDGRSELLIQV